MKSYFPGTVIERNGQDARSFLFSIFAVTKGLMLAQVREITGLDTPAIQNWINRGWVARPVEKRYSMDHLARIMIINMLRDVMKLDHISVLLTFINGRAEDASDNIVSESDLYCYLCSILDKVSFEEVLSEEEFFALVEKEISDYQEPWPGARRRLMDGIHVILIYYAASIIKKKADGLYSQVLETPPSVLGKGESECWNGGTA